MRLLFTIALLVVVAHVSATPRSPRFMEVVNSLQAKTNPISRYDAIKKDIWGTTAPSHANESKFRKCFREWLERDNALDGEAVPALDKWQILQLLPISREFGKELTINKAASTVVPADNDEVANSASYFSRAITKSAIKNCAQTTMTLAQIIQRNTELNANVQKLTTKVGSKPKQLSAIMGELSTRFWQDSAGHKFVFFGIKNEVKGGDGHLATCERYKTVAPSGNDYYVCYTAWVGHNTLVDSLATDSTILASFTMSETRMKTFWDKIENNRPNIDSLFLARADLKDKDDAGPGFVPDDRASASAMATLDHEGTKTCAEAWDPAFDYSYKLSQCTYKLLAATDLSAFSTDSKVGGFAGVHQRMAGLNCAGFLSREA